MGLKDYAPATEEIQLPDGSTFSVRGLALQDITVLLRSHHETAERLFNKYVSEAAMDAASAASPNVDFGASDMRGVILDVLDAAPAMLSDVIAQAAEEPELSGLVARLPLGVQIEATEAIVRLTLEAEGGMEKLVETVNKLTTSLAGLEQDRSR